MRNLFKRKELALHLAFWMLFGSYSYLTHFEHNDKSLKCLLEQLNRLLFSVYVAYINFLFLFPYFYRNKKYVQLALAELALLLSAAISSCFIFKTYVSRCNCGILPCFFNAFLALLTIVILFGCLFIAKKYQQKKTLLEQQEKNRLQTELKFLKSQISPHFLFNNLNTLYSYSLEHSNAVPQIILKMADGLRYMLYESDAERVLLKKEIDYLKNYTDLQSLRNQERLEVNLDIDPKLADSNLYIAPFILLPFVENAFKHSTDNELAHPRINISLSAVGDTLHFYCANSYSEAADRDPQEKKIKSGGIGLENVKKRLKITYAGQYTLEIDKGKDMFTVNLKLTLI